MEPRPRVATTNWPLYKPGTLRVEEAATLLGVSRSCVYDQIRRGVIPALKFGRARRISRTVIDRMLADGVTGQ